MILVQSLDTNCCNSNRVIAEINDKKLKNINYETN